MRKSPPKIDIRLHFNAQDRLPKLAPGTEIMIANCLAHGRRQFVDIVQNFPAECRYVLEMLGRVYGFETEVRKRGLKGACPFFCATWVRDQNNGREKKPTLDIDGTMWVR